MIDDTQKRWLTRDGFDRLAEELRRLKEVERRKVAEMLEAARSHGDLRENSEYQAAKDHQGFIESRIAKLESLLREASIAEEGEWPEGQIAVGSFARLRDGTGHEERFHLVGSEESDPEAGKVSVDSPLGKALLGKTIGDQVTVNAPAGQIVYEVVEVEAPGG